ncbi:MAG: hypothetical protein KKA79_09405, partial [Nanoarchaeota archaeon]|nr:hypothetical protein [Nanoarchaeota archaeon]
KIDEISNQREILEQNLDKIKEPDNFFLDYLIEKKVEIKEKISAEYPGILDKSDSNLNITYPADIEINTANLQTLIKDTAKEINSKLMMRYNDSSLNGVANTSRDSLELKHIAKLIKVIEIYELKLISAKKVGGTDIALKNNIKKLKSEEETIWKSNLGAEEKKLFEEYLENNSDVLSKSRLFSEYVVYKHKADDYLEKFGDKNRYWSDSIFAEIRREMQEGYKDLDAFLDDDNKNLVQDSLNDYLKSEGLEAKVADMKNPSNLKFNLLWCLLGNALLFPIIRNFMVKKYVDDDPNGEDYFGSFTAAVGSWGVGCAITDGLHPLAYWVRMASPLVIQPVRKLLKGKDGY